MFAQRDIDILENLYPRRREGGNFVIEAVPLIGSREARKAAMAG